MIPPGLLFGTRLLSIEGWGQIFPKWPPQEKGTLMNIPESFASSVLLPEQATYIPVFPGGTPRPAVRFDPDSYGEFALPWDPVHIKICVHLLRMGSPFLPVPWTACAHAPLTFKARCSGGSFSQCQIPMCGGLTWSSELSLL